MQSIDLESLVYVGVADTDPNIVIMTTVSAEGRLSVRLSHVYIFKYVPARAAHTRGLYNTLMRSLFVISDQIIEIINTPHSCSFIFAMLLILPALPLSLRFCARSPLSPILYTPPIFTHSPCNIFHAIHPNHMHHALIHSPIRLHTCITYSPSSPSSSSLLAVPRVAVLCYARTERTSVLSWIAAPHVHL